MASQAKEIYEITSEYRAFYTGGEVAWSVDGAELLCQCEEELQRVDVTSGRTAPALTRSEDDAEEDLIYTFALSHTNEYIVTAHRSGLMKLWSKSDGKRIKMWRSGHKGPVARLTFDASDENIASGGSDGVIRLWDPQRQACTGSLRGATGVFSVVRFHSSRQLVFGAADDAKIRSWDSKVGKEHQTYSGHFSKVTAIQFTADGQHMVSSGRDRVLILWNVDVGKAVRTLPVYESIESLVILPQKFKIPNFKKSHETEGIFVACGGEKGAIKVWNIEVSRLMFEQNNSLVSAASEEGGLSVVHLLYNEARKCLAVITADHNIIIHDLKTFGCVKQMVGFTDEVLDVIFLGQDDAHVVVATNSADLKHYNLETMNCEIIKGHTDIVLALARFPTHPDTFVSSGKDNSVRLWTKKADNTIWCLGVGSRHTASVGSVFTSQSSNSFLVSVGQDNCLKVWSTPKQPSSDERTLKSIHTELAHQADINCVTVSPNDKMIATGSQDKTAKLWSEDLALLGVLRGHRRGVWCVRFSPIDQVLLSCSADCTIKLWSIAELNCLKTLEGHESSVLKVEFLSKGSQLISSGADGLLKLWTIKTSECKMSLDNHEGKVWSLAVSKDESVIVTGGSDSKLVRWKDVTAERKEKLAKEREEMVMHEQELSNLLHDKKLVKALKLALRLDRPLHVLRIINEIVKEENNKLYETIKEINDTQKEALLKCAAEWNTNTKNCHAAQLVFNVLSSELVSGQLKVASLPALVEGVLPYTERHYDRLTSLLQDLSLITYTVNSMQPHTILNT